MNTLSSNMRRGLLGATLAIGLATLAAKPGYFGDEFAQAQQALKDKPAAEMPQAF
jgi:TolA-binding protein